LSSQLDKSRPPGQQSTPQFRLNRKLLDVLLRLAFQGGYSTPTVSIAKNDNQSNVEKPWRFCPAEPSFSSGVEDVRAGVSGIGIHLTRGVKRRSGRSWLVCCWVDKLLKHNNKQVECSVLGCTDLCLAFGRIFGWVDQRLRS
jgi:hypothetical protein